MRFKLAPSFDGDLRRLSRDEQRLFRKVVVERFAPACDRRASDPGAPWPQSLRVKRVQGTRGIWEMTWSFSGPDGRATFEWREDDRGLFILWRRVGGHAIFKDPAGRR